MSWASPSALTRNPICGLVILTTLVFPMGSHAASFTKLYSFCALSNCKDGGNPRRGLTIDAAGNLYGVTSAGGGAGNGVVFELIRGAGGYSYRRIHSFCSKTNCNNGDTPNGRLIVDVNGNVYGVTYDHVFELVPNATKTKWKYNVLYTFCSKANCVDGSDAIGALTYVGAAEGARYDGTSPLFGSAYNYGKYGPGVSYELIFVPGKVRRNEKVIYNFCAQPNCTDGGVPNELVADSQGNLFGTTAGWGADDEGVLFELTPKPKGGFHYSLLHTFGSQQGDGSQPLSPLVLGPDGALIGTTQQGGANGDGTIFSSVPGSGKESILYSFCSAAGCADGGDPFTAGVALNANGAMLGSAGGGDAGYGVVYSLQNGSEQVLKTFCEEQYCSDGSEPLDGVTLDDQGNVFGTTQEGGDHNGGIVFEITP